MTTRRHPRATLATTLAAVLGVGACGGDVDGSVAESTSLSDPHDVTQWSPSFTPSSLPVTSAEESQSRLDQVIDMSRAHGLPLPDSEDDLPDLVRTVSSHEAAELWAQCLTDRGFEAAAVGGAVEMTELVPEQRDMYHQAFADCVARYPIDARFFQTWGEDQWKVQYEYLTGYYIPCVESYGVQINPDTIPEERVYIEAGLSGRDVWHPVLEWTNDPTYSELRSTDQPEGRDLADKCRQGAPDDALFGSP